MKSKANQHRINEILRDLNLLANELSKLEPKLEEDVMMFQNRLSYHYWSNNQLSFDF